MRSLKLHHWILIAMLLGAAIGLPLNWATEEQMLDLAWSRKAASLGQGVGDLFLRLLQMLVVPLIISSLISGVSSLGDIRRLGRIGGRTLVYYLCTSLLAIITGLFVVNLVAPGSHADVQLLRALGGDDALLPIAAQTNEGVGAILWQQLHTLIPKNPIASAAQGQMLPIIFFSLLFGTFLGIALHSEQTETKAAQSVDAFFRGLFEVMMRMTLAVIQLAPIGVFGFMLAAAAGSGIAAFTALGWYVVCVAIALGIHAFLTLPLLLKWFARRSPKRYAKAMAPALLTAFSTASSNGTLPLTMHSVEKDAGVSTTTTGFVLPLGATINMDGTALYEAVAVLFIAQVYGLDLSLIQQSIVALTALLASIGAAGIPHAGAVMMVVVLSAVGLPTSAVGLILAVDRILDMCRTTVNVWSDSIGAAIVDRLTNQNANA